MKRAVIVVAGAFVVLAIEGCAALIGASFDDAGLVQYDAADADVHEATLHFDVADSKPFDPSALPNLAFWLDAHQQVDVGDASNDVTTWHDLSGHLDRDAIAVNGYGAPTLVASGINGQPSVHFVAASFQLLATNWIGPGSTEFTFVVVTQGYPESVLRFQTSAGSTPLLIFPYDFAGSEQAPNFGFEIYNSATDYAQVRTTIGTGPTIATAVLRTSTITTYTNGNLVEQRLSSTMFAGTRLFVGGIPYPGAAVYTDGDIGEVLVYDSALSDTDRAELEEYLSIKWSIAL